MYVRDDEVDTHEADAWLAANPHIPPEYDRWGWLKERCVFPEHGALVQAFSRAMTGIPWVSMDIVDQYEGDTIEALYEAEMLELEVRYSDAPPTAEVVERASEVGARARRLLERDHRWAREFCRRLEKERSLRRLRQLQIQSRQGWRRGSARIASRSRRRSGDAGHTPTGTDGPSDGDSEPPAHRRGAHRHSQIALPESLLPRCA